MTALETREAYIESRRALFRLYPDDGPLARGRYPRHLEFFAAGLGHSERAFIAANRTGKTTCAGYEMALHLTGKYPEWWPGFRFDRPIAAWAAGEDIRSMRESVQPLLFGKTGELGTGLIPGDDIIGNPTMGRGVPDSIDSAQVRHVKGGSSRLVLKTYEQGREAFQAAAIDVGWCDEEPPQPIYTEMLTRLMSTVPGKPNGLMLCTFTPLKGMSDVVMKFLGEGATHATPTPADGAPASHDAN